MPGATFKGRVIPGWSLPSPRSPAAAHLPLPARCLRRRGESVRDVRSFRWSYLNVSDLPIAPSNSTHSPSSTQTPQPAGFRRINSCQSLPLLPPLLSRQTEEFISSEGLFFSPRFGSGRFSFRQAADAPQEPTSTPACVRSTSSHRHTPTLAIFAFFVAPPLRMPVGFSPLRLSSWKMEKSSLI